MTVAGFEQDDVLAADLDYLEDLDNWDPDESAHMSAPQTGFGDLDSLIEYATYERLEGFSMPEPGLELLSDDSDDRHRIVEEKIASFKPLPDWRESGKRAKKAQDKAWEAWATYILKDARKDPAEIMLEFCLDKPSGHKYCQAFLENYVERSAKPRLTLAKSEKVLARTVTSVNSVIEFWESLVGAAERGVLQHKRWEDPDNKDQWYIMKRSPSSKLRKWIEGAMADKYKLTRRQTFVKEETTIDDTLLIVETVWTRAIDIPCDPSTLLAFHTVTVMDSLGGWRLGCLMEFPYRNVELSAVRDPGHRTRTAIVATVTLEQNKRKENKAQGSQDDIIAFSITTIPCEMICLTRLLIARAIEDNAFEAGYESYEELLNSPSLETVDYVPLHWKKEFMDRPIIPIQYNTFWRIWKRTLFVMGCRRLLRPNSMRVGGGGRLDGPLTPAVRNYILSHSSPVFEKSYQPRHIREDLANLAYGDRLGGRNEKLNLLLRRSTYQRDDAAPLYPRKSDLEWFEARKDVQLLRKCHNEAILEFGSHSLQAKKHGARVWDRINALSSLVVKLRRAKYFQEADRLRARGLSTTHLREPSGDLRRKSANTNFVATLASRIGSYLAGRNADTPHDSTAFVDGLVRFFRNTDPFPGYQALPVLGAPTSVKRGKPGHKEAERQGQCFFCDRIFSRRSNLTRHYNKIHPHQFKEPIPCPKCKDVGKNYEVKDEMDWSSHVTRHHGKDNAPNFLPTRRDKAQSRMVRCLICNTWHSNNRNLTRHCREIHEAAGLFETAFRCPECHRLGEVTEVTDRGDWSEHLKWKHYTQDAEEPPASDKYRPCLICAGEFAHSRFTEHFQQLHVRKEGLFRGPFSCPACQLHGRTVEIKSYGDWFCHEAEHGQLDKGGATDLSIHYWEPTPSCKPQPRAVKRPRPHTQSTCVEGAQPARSKRRKQEDPSDCIRTPPKTPKSPSASNALSSISLATIDPLLLKMSGCGSCMNGVKALFP